MNLRSIIGVAILAAAAGCGQSSSSPSSPTAPANPTPSSGTNVSIAAGSSTKGANAYAPNPIAVSRGAAVTWMNNDTIVHTSTADGGAWNSGNLAPGATFTATFPTSGTFTYHCLVHPGMVGTVTVQ